MTIENVYDKMILGEIPPENAIAFFKMYASKMVANLNIEAHKFEREKTINEQYLDMLSPGYVGKKAVNDFNQLAQQVKVKGYFIGEYIKQAEMLKKQTETIKIKKEPDVLTGKHISDVNEILKDLVTEGIIKHEKTNIKDRQFETYKLNKIYKTVRDFIKQKIDDNIYEIKDIDVFMCTYIRSKKNNSLNQAFQMYKKRTNNH